MVVMQLRRCMMSGVDVAGSSWRAFVLLGRMVGRERTLWRVLKRPMTLSSQLFVLCRCGSYPLEGFEAVQPGCGREPSRRATPPAKRVCKRSTEDHTLSNTS